MASPEKSRFLNRRGFFLDDKHIVQGIKWRHFHLWLEHPLTYFHTPTGLYYQPNRSFLTDGFSAPRWAYLICPSLKPFGAYEIAGFIHDSAYRFCGLHTCTKFDGIYTFRKMPREECDGLLHDMVLTLDAWPVTADAVYCAVQIGGWPRYGKGDLRHKLLAGNERPNTKT